MIEPPIPHSTPTAAQTTTLNAPPNTLANTSAPSNVATKRGNKRALPVSTPSSSDPVELLAKAEASTLKALGTIGIDVSKELLAELCKLNPGEKKKRIQELSRISAYELEIENNKARNRALAQQLGIVDAAHLFAAAQVKEPERPAVPGDEDDYAPSKKYASTENDRDQARRSLRNKTPTSTAPPASTVLPTAVLPPANTSDVSCPNMNDGDAVLPDATTCLDMDDQQGEDGRVEGMNIPLSATAPKWFADGWKAFSTVVPETYGTAWFDAVKAWRTLEEATGFGPQVRTPIFDGRYI